MADEQRAEEPRVSVGSSRSEEPSGSAVRFPSREGVDEQSLGAVGGATETGSEHTPVGPAPARVSQVDEFLRAIAGMTSIVQQQQQQLREVTGAGAREAAQVPRRATMMEHFQKLNPPTYRGTEGAEKAEEWIERLQKIFLALECSEDDRMALAEFVLVGEAEKWWRATRPILMQRPGGPMWEEFTRAFLAKYFPYTFQEQKKREFDTLTQRGRSVDVYEGEFARLSKYAPYLVSEPRERARRFEYGLDPAIRDRLAPLMIEDYDEVYRRAQRTERFLQETRAQYSARSGGAPSSGGGKRPFEGGSSSGFGLQGAPKRGGGSGFLGPSGFSGAGGFPFRGSGFPSRGSSSSSRGSFSVGQLGGRAGGRAGDGGGRSGGFGGRSGGFGGRARGRGDPMQPCRGCGREHRGYYCDGTPRVCFTCGQPGHHRRECPQGQVDFPAGPASSGYFPHYSQPRPAASSQGSVQRPPAQARVFALTQEEADASHTVISGNGSNLSCCLRLFLRVHVLVVLATRGCCEIVWLMVDL